jgi:hypothetical protein
MFRSAEMAAFEGEAVLGLHHSDDVGADVLRHPGRVGHGEFVDAVGGQLHPADPVGAAVRDDLDAALSRAPV